MSEGLQMQGCGPGTTGEESLYQDRGGCRLGRALLYKELLCFDTSEKPQLAHWGTGQPQGLVCGSTAEVSCPASHASGSADRGTFVPCPLCGAQGVGGYGQGWEQPLISQSSAQ